MDRAAPGRVTSAFRPDFYLPELDLFIELTTLRQRLVTPKNRKLRRLRALHPDVNIRMLYLRDYLALVHGDSLRALLFSPPDALSA